VISTAELHMERVAVGISAENDTGGCDFCGDIADSALHALQQPFTRHHRRLTASVSLCPCQKKKKKKRKELNRQCESTGLNDVTPLFPVKHLCHAQRSF